MPFGLAGALSKAGAPTSGVAQVETATIVGTITSTGDATFTITAAGMTGSPLAIAVAVLNGDTVAVVAGKAAVVLNANANVSAMFTATTNGADLILTAKKAAANDATLNVAFTNGTCTGLTPNATSANTTAGVKGDYRGAEYGTALIDTTNTNIYRNTGSNLVPTWTLE
jgi:phage tail sheath gpL-like